MPEVDVIFLKIATDTFLFSIVFSSIFLQVTGIKLGTATFHASQGFMVGNFFIIIAKFNLLEILSVLWIKGRHLLTFLLSILANIFFNFLLFEIILCTEEFSGHWFHFLTIQEKVAAV